MLLLLLCICVICTIPSALSSVGGTSSIGPTGSVSLDDISFDKVVDKFDATLVKFDVAFPFGDKHEAFVGLARETKEITQLLVAEVGVKDYGDRDNEGLAKKYGATKENFPVVKLLIKGKAEPITFDDSNGFTSDQLRKFVKEKSGIHLSLPGCIYQLDKIAIEFMKTNKKEERQKLLKQAETEAKGLPEKDAASAKIYKLVMKKILEKGDDFAKSEYQRVSKLAGGKISEEKRKEIVNKIHILHTFQVNDQEKKEEL